MANWIAAYLRAIGAPNTSQNRSFLQTWQRWEGGHTNNDARFNWLNTTTDGPGAVRDINSVGVTAFDSFQNGVNAWKRTVLSGKYGDIVSALRSGNPYQSKPVAGLSTWLSGKPNSQAGMEYASRVLGTPVTRQTAGVSERAQEAFWSGPGGVAASPSPNVLLQHRQNTALQFLEAANRTVAGAPDEGQLLAGLVESRQELRKAQAAANASEAQARTWGGTTAPADAPMAPPGSSEQLQTILRVAHAQVGKPYVWGAESPAEGGFDCSGLIDYSFKKAGVPIPGRLTTYTAMQLGRSVKGGEYQAGDWIITNGGKHMVMYVGNGQVIAAPRRGEVVQYQPLSRFKGQIVDVRRFLQ